MPLTSEGRGGEGGGLGPLGERVKGAGVPRMVQRACPALAKPCSLGLHCPKQGFDKSNFFYNTCYCVAQPRGFPSLSRPSV